MINPFSPEHPILTGLSMGLVVLGLVSIGWIAFTHFFRLRARDYPDIEFEPIRIPPHLKFFTCGAMLLVLPISLLPMWLFTNWIVYLTFTVALFCCWPFVLKLMDWFPLIQVKPTLSQTDPPLTDVAKEILLRELRKKPE